MAPEISKYYNRMLSLSFLMNYPAAELRSIKMNFYLFNPDAEHRGILLIKIDPPAASS